MRGNELFNQHAAKWLRQIGALDGQPLETAIARGKEQILSDVRAGQVPEDVSSLSDLHDHVDANGYGDVFSWPVLPSETDDDAYQQAFADFWNHVQDTLSDWISSGQMQDDLNRK